MVCFVWLAWLIGPSFLAGVFALFISVPCQATVLKVYFKAQIERLKVTDQRIKLTNEMVQGMRVVKMYAWEQTIGSKLAEVRAKELRLKSDDDLERLWAVLAMERTRLLGEKTLLGRKDFNDPPDRSSMDAIALPTQERSAHIILYCI